MKKTNYIIIFISSLTLTSCSNNENEDKYEDCQCETIVFKQTINLAEGIYKDYITRDCLSFWENDDFINLTIDKTTSPLTIYGPSEKEVEISKDSFNRCQ